MTSAANVWARMLARLAAAWEEFIREVREAMYVPEGVDDPRWRAELARAAAPVRASRLVAESRYLSDMTTDSLPVIALNPDGSVMVTSTVPGAVVPAKPKVMKLTPEQRRIRKAEDKFRGKVDAIVAEAMLELGLSPAEILHEWSRSLGEELAELRVWQG